MRQYSGGHWTIAEAKHPSSLCIGINRCPFPLVILFPVIIMIIAKAKSKRENEFGAQNLRVQIRNDVHVTLKKQVMRAVVQNSRLVAVIISHLYYFTIYDRLLAILKRRDGLLKVLPHHTRSIAWYGLVLSCPLSLPTTAKRLKLYCPPQVKTFCVCYCKVFSTVSNATLKIQLRYIILRAGFRSYSRDDQQKLKLLLSDLNQIHWIGFIKRNILGFKSFKSDVPLQSYGL